MFALWGSWRAVSLTTATTSCERLGSFMMKAGDMSPGCIVATVLLYFLRQLAHFEKGGAVVGVHHHAAVVARVLVLREQGLWLLRK